MFHIRLGQLFLVLFSVVLFQSASAATDAAPTASPEAPAESSFEKVSNEVGAVVDSASKTLGETRELRAAANYFVFGSYSPIDLLVPSKLGASVGLINSADKTWEFEFLKGSISVPFLVKDLGEMTDLRLSLIGRSYFGSNSFHFSYGVSYFDFRISLGNDIVNRATSGGYPDLDLIALSSLGFNVGVGNRWTFKHNVTFGVDWISWNQPVFGLTKKAVILDYATNRTDRDDIDTAIKLISYLPRFTVFKVQLGILF